MKRFPFMILCSLALSAPMLAQFSANLAVTSNYVWRGISQNEEDPALQGGVDYSATCGFYAGLWGSNVPDGLDVEVDGYLGWSKEVENGLSFDLGYIHYYYTGDSDADLGEIYAGLGYKIFSTKFYRDADNKTNYLEAGVELSLPAEFTLGLRAGKYDTEGGDPFDWETKLTRPYKMVEFSALVADSDAEGSDVQYALTVKINFGG